MTKLFLTSAVAALAISAAATAQNSNYIVDLSGDQRASDNFIFYAHQERLKSLQSNVAALEATALNVQTVDVAVWYSPVWENEIGTQEAIRRIDAWFADINRGLIQSGAYVQYHPVFAKPLVWDVRDSNPDCNSNDCTTLIQGNLGATDYASLMYTTLPWTSSRPEPKSAVTSREFGADLHLWIQSATDVDLTDGPLGTARTFGRTAQAADQSMAPAVVADGLADNGLVGTSRTIMHELGHNFGLQHEKANADGWNDVGAPEYAFAWSCGQGNTPGSANTALWSVSFLGYEKRNLLSNPDVMRDGQACGDPQEADQARHVNEYAETVATLAERPAVTGTVAFDKATYTVLPGQDELIVNVTRSGDLTEYAEVQVVATNGSAVEGEDYLFSGQIIGDAERYEAAGAVVTFQPGQATGLATIKLTNNDTSATKTFDLALRFPLRLDPQDSTAMVELQGDTPLAQSGTISVDQNTIVLAENSEHVVTLTRSGDVSGEAVVNVKTVDGTGEAGLNYFAINRAVRFLPNESETQFSVYSGESDDATTFSINLSSDTGVSFNDSVINATVKSGQNGLATFPLAGDVVWNPCVDVQTAIDRTDFPASGFVCGFYSEYEENTLSFPVTIERLNGSAGELDVSIRLVPQSDIFYEEDGETVYTLFWDYIDRTAPILDSSMVSWSEQVITLEDGESSRVIDLEVTGLPENAEQDGFTFLLEIESDEPLTYTYKAGAQGFYVANAVMGDDDGGGDGGGNDGGGNGGGGNDGGGNGGDDQDPVGGGDGGSDGDSGRTSGGSTSLMFLGMMALLGLGRLKRKRS